MRRRLFPTAHRLLVEQALRTLDLSDARDVLVVGAGEDPYRARFGELRRYVRLDLVPRRDHTDVAADAHRLPFEAGTFDCLFASEVLEHLRAPQDFVREGLAGACFKDVLAAVGDHLFDASTGRGEFIFYNTGPLKQGKIDVIAIGATQDEAERNATELLPKLLGV